MDEINLQLYKNADKIAVQTEKFYAGNLLMSAQMGRNFMIFAWKEESETSKD